MKQIEKKIWKDYWIMGYNNGYSQNYVKAMELLLPPGISRASQASSLAGERTDDGEN